MQDERKGLSHPRWPIWLFGALLAGGAILAALISKSKPTSASKNSGMREATDHRENDCDDQPMQNINAQFDCPPKSEEEKQREESRVTRDWIKLATDWVLGLLTLTVLLVSTCMASRAAKQANAIALQALQADRPWVGASSIEVTDSSAYPETRDGNGSVTFDWKIRIYIRNYGKKPGTRVAVYTSQIEAGPGYFSHWRQNYGQVCGEATKRSKSSETGPRTIFPNAEPQVADFDVRREHSSLAGIVSSFITVCVAYADGNENHYTSTLFYTQRSQHPETLTSPNYPNLKYEKIDKLLEFTSETDSN